MTSYVSRRASAIHGWTRRLATIVLVAAAGASWPAHADRSVPEDFTTQLAGSDHRGSLGPDAFGDTTDFYSGSTQFLVTDVSLPGNSDLPVAMQRSLEAFDSGLGSSLGGLGDAFMKWSRYDVPYLSGVYADDGWVATNLHDPTTQRCSVTTAPPDLMDGKGLFGEWPGREYWHGIQLYMPGSGSQLLLVTVGGSPPTDGPTYRWMTKEHWYFSCLPTTVNGQPGEAFLARSPDGKKYYFNHLVNWSQVSTLRKVDEENDVMTLVRHEYRMLLTRVEDRFGNWVQYAYSGKDLTSITANDGRQLTLTYAAPGGALTSVSDGTRTWTYDYTSGVSVTYPDSTVWQSNVSGPGITRNNLGHPDGSVSCENATYTGSKTLTIQLRSGAFGTFQFAPVRRGLSHVPYNPVTRPCPNQPKYIDSIALVSKSITGAGLPPAGWTYAYGPANGCYEGPANSFFNDDPCTAASPTTRYIEVSAPGTFTRYTFGNIWGDTDGALVRVERGSSSSNILQDTTQTWQQFSAPAVLPDSAGGTILSKVVRALNTRTIAQGGATYATTNSNFDTYFQPQTIAETGPNGGSRTTLLTYRNDRALWVIGLAATQSSAGKSISRTFDNTNSTVLSVTEDGVTHSYTYNADGTVATTTDPRSYVHSFSSYKRGIPQSESHPEGVNIARVVDNRGFVTSQTDGELRTTSYGYDPAGRLTSIDHPIGNDVTINYSGASKSTKTTTRGGLVQTVSYDALWRPTSVALGGITTTYQYDAYGRVTFQSNPNDTLGTTTEYDALDRITRITHPDSTYRAFTFGTASVTTRDERANLTTQTFRAYGDPNKPLLMSITAPLAAANVAITRDPNGLVRSVVQAGKTRTLDYDVHNYLIAEAHPETGTTAFERDLAGNMKARTIGGIRTDYTYDGLNRLSGMTYSDGTAAVTQTYSKTSQLKTVTSTVASRVLGYDANDNLTTETLTVGATVLSATYGYNGNDRLSSITYPISGRVVNYSPDAFGRPTLVSGYATAVTHWPSGQLQQINYANGTVTNYDQNTRLWPSTFTARRGSVYSVSSTYGYDGAGNVSSITDTVDAMMNRTLGYDALDRLTSASGPWGAGTIAYDGAGNITSQSLGSFNLTYSYDPQNRLGNVSGSKSASYTYDGRGNVTAAGTKTYNYDAIGNLLCAQCAGPNRADYAYDGLRNRVKVTNAGTLTYEFHAHDGELLVEYTPSQSNRLVEHIYVDGKRIAQRVSDSTPATSITPTVTNVTVNTSGGFVIGVNIGGTAPSGTVAFSKASTALGTAYVASSQAIIEVTGLTAGANSITAVYSGDANNSGNSLTYSVTATIPIPGAPASIAVPTSSTTGSYNVDWGAAASGWVQAYELYEATNSSFAGQTLAYSGTARTRSFSGKGNGTYYYRVRACNPSGCSAYVPGADATTVALPPGTPPSITVPASSNTGNYTISWTAPTTGVVTVYELYQAVNGGSYGVFPYTTTSTSFAFTNVGNGTYTYRVRACNGSSCSGYRTGGNSLVVTLPPSVPGAVVVPAYNNTGNYTVSWGASTGNVTAYEVLESIAFGSESLVYSGTATSFPRSTKPDGVWGYRLRACNGTQCSAYNATQGNGGVIYVDKIAPTPPTTLIFIQPNYTINWSGGSTDTAGAGAGSGVGSWNVYRNGSLIGSSNQPQVSFRDATPPTNTALTYTVKSVDRAGNISAASSGLALYVDTIPPTTPGNFQATSVTTGSVSLAWTASTDAFGISWYRIARSPGSANMGNGNASTSFVDSTVASNTTYTYQVFAVDGHGVESAPASLTVTTPAGAPPIPIMNGSLNVQDNDGSYNVSWSASTGAAYYILEENGSPITVTGTSRQFNNGSGEYAYRVKACSSANVCSGYSATKNVRVCIGSCQ